MNAVKLEYYAPGVQKVVPKSRGLGDTVEKVTKALGIKAVVDKISEITGEDCGCQGRKESLNKMFPYKN